MSRLLVPFTLLFHDWNLTRELFHRTLVQRFVMTKLGWWWMLINPMLLIGVYVLMFGVLFPIRGPGESPMLHALSIAQCLMMYYVFADSTGAACAALVRQPGLVKRQAIPLALLPILELYPSLVQFVPCTLIIVGLGLGFGVGLSAGYFGILLLLPPLMLIAAGVSWALAAGTVYFRDLEPLYNHLARIFLYTSGVFWGLSQLPIEARKYFAPLPLMEISELTRGFAFGGQWSWGQVGYVYGAAFAIFYAGFVIFERLKRGVADHL